jgi:hypothetical protein
MGEEPLRKMVAPNFRTPRLIGIFSVVFASELLIVGFCLGGYAAIMPMIGRFTSTAQKQMDAQVESANKAELAALAVREKKAKTDEEKIDVAARRKEIESRTKNPLSSVMALNQVTLNRTFITYSWADVLTGMTLNVMMLAAGIGLLSWRPWSRRLAIWTAGLKIVRLVLLYGFFIIAIVPPYAKQLGDAVEQMMGASAQMSGGKAPIVASGFYTKVYTVMYSGFGVGVIVTGVIFPAIVIWCLTRPSVVSACSGLLRTPKEPNQPC